MSFEKISGLFWFAACAILLNSIALQAQAQTDPLTDPLTDPTAQTQTKAAPKATTPAATNALPSQQKPTAQAQAAKQQIPQRKTETELPAPEDMILDTSDGVRLRVTYLAPPKAQAAPITQKPTDAATVSAAAAKAVPFILLHDWEGNRNDLAQYAIFLQKKGHAVIVPDLRGHGGSTGVVGVSQSIDATKFRKNEVMSAQKDIERCKKFLVQRHNKGELNIDLLCVVAVGQTSVLAVQWTLNDWVAFPAFNSKGIKQGQDVKALMLVSPVKKLAGVSMTPSLKHGLFSGNNAMPVMIVWGVNEETTKETESIYNSLEKSRPDLKDIRDPAERMALTTLFEVKIDKHPFSGKQMIEQQRVDGFFEYVTSRIFENKVVANAKSFPWITREDKKEADDE